MSSGMESYHSSLFAKTGSTSKITPRNGKTRWRTMSPMPKRACDTGGASVPKLLWCEVLINLNLVRAGRIASTRLHSAPCFAKRRPRLAPAPLGSGFASAERWLSGRKHRTRNATYGQLYRGFESLPLRHILVFHSLPISIKRLENLRNLSNPLSCRFQVSLPVFPKRPSGWWNTWWD